MTGSLQERKDENVGWNYHLNRNNILNKAIMESSRSLHTDMDLADLRTDVVPKAQIRIANRLSRLSHKAFRRNSVSVEQIQDASYRLNVLTSFQHSNVGNSQQTELTPLTILTPLTFAPCNRVETLAMTAFSGEGGAKL